MLLSRASALAAVVLAIGRMAVAQTCPPDCVGGGRNPSADCLVEFGGLQATDETCFDGNPSCDSDGMVDGVCTLGLSVCLNVAGDAACVPGGMTKLPSVRPARSATARLLSTAIATLDPSQAGCTAPGLAVPLTTSLKGVKQTVARVTITGGSGKDRDRNPLRLTCQASPLAPSLAHVLEPIFQTRCALPTCHVSVEGGSAPMFDQPDVYDQIVNVPATNFPALMLVHPGSVSQSYLARKILGKRIPDHTARMPNGCPDTVPAGGCLTDGEIAAILAWIQAGAPNN
jgi:hypothetical protein